MKESTRADKMVELQQQVSAALDKESVRRPTFGTIRRKVAKEDVRALTYIVYITLECGHSSSYTLSAKRVHDPKAHLKSTGCYECWKEQEK